MYKRQRADHARARRVWEVVERELRHDPRVRVEPKRARGQAAVPHFVWVGSPKPKAKRPARGGAPSAPAFAEGDRVAYLGRAGEAPEPAYVARVHSDDGEPYYTIRFAFDAGRERQTTAAHLTRA